MNLYRATKSFRAKPISSCDSPAIVLQGTCFIVSTEAALPDPMAGLRRDVFEQIVPKNLLIKLDTFVKAKPL